jgi:hypothetical protein
MYDREVCKASGDDGMLVPIGVFIDNQRALKPGTSGNKIVQCV